LSGPVPPTVDELVADALTTVRLVPRWQLPARAWPEIESALVRLDEAMTVRDPARIHKILDELERHGPTRLTPIGRTPEGGQRPGGEAPPRAVLDLVNRLVHPAGGWAADTTSQARPGADP
jgi:hypothetical protein